MKELNKNKFNSYTNEIKKSFYSNEVYEQFTMFLLYFRMYNYN